MKTRVTSLATVPPPASGFLRWLAGWLSLLARARRARREMAQRNREMALRVTVLRGALTHRSPEEITARIAGAMYEVEIRHGAGSADIGLFGPRLFRHDAHAFLVALLTDQR
jgi:hypothetical protein